MAGAYLGAYGARPVGGLPVSLGQGSPVGPVSTALAMGLVNLQGRVSRESTTTATIHITPESAAVLPTDVTGRCEVCCLIDSGERAVSNGDRQMYHLMHLPFATQRVEDKETRTRRDDVYRRKFTNQPRDQDLWFNPRTLGEIQRYAPRADSILRGFTEEFQNSFNRAEKAALWPHLEHVYVNTGTDFKSIPMMASPLHSSHSDVQRLLSVFTDRVTLYSRSIQTQRLSMHSMHGNGYLALTSQTYNTIVVPTECARHEMPLYAVATIMPDPEVFRSLVIALIDAPGHTPQVEQAAKFAFHLMAHPGNPAVPPNYTSDMIRNEKITDIVMLLHAFKNPMTLSQNGQGDAVVDALLTMASIGNVQTFMVAGDPESSPSHKALRDILPHYRARLIGQVARSGVNVGNEARLPPETYAVDPVLHANNVKLPLRNRLPTMERILLASERNVVILTS